MLYSTCIKQVLYSTRLNSTSISFLAMLIAASKLYSTRASYIAWPKVPDGWCARAPTAHTPRLGCVRPDRTHAKTRPDRTRAPTRIMPSWPGGSGCMFGARGRRSCRHGRGLCLKFYQICLRKQSVLPACPKCPGLQVPGGGGGGGGWSQVNIWKCAELFVTFWSKEYGGVKELSGKYE